MRVAAFDLGASGGKLFLIEYANHRLTLEEVHRFEHTCEAFGDGLFWNFFQIWQELCAGLKKAVRLTDDGIDSFGVDAFSNDFGLLAHNGDLISPVRSYRDARTTVHGNAIYARLAPEALYRLSGNQIAPFSTLMQLAAMREAGQGALLDSCHTLLHLPDLLLYGMTGQRHTERSLASVSQMYNDETGDWHDDILRAFAIPRRILPPIVNSGTRLGHITRDLQHRLGSRGFPVTAVCEHDTASAYMAAPAAEDGFLLSSGTWALLGQEVPHPFISAEGFRHNLTNEGGARWRLLRNVMGSWLIQEMRRELAQEGLHVTYAELDAMAEAVPAFRCVIDVDDPAFFTPGRMREKIAAQCVANGFAAPENTGHMVRAVQEGLALKYRDVMGQLEAVSGRGGAVINLFGGGSKGHLACRFTASACNKPVLAGPEEASALGNAIMQYMAHGVFNSLEEGRAAVAASFPPKRFEPEQPEQWDAPYAELLRLSENRSRNETDKNAV